MPAHSSIASVCALMRDRAKYRPHHLLFGSAWPVPICAASLRSALPVSAICCYQIRRDDAVLQLFMKPGIRRYLHTMLRVRNRAAALKFYQDPLELKEFRRVDS